MNPHLKKCTGLVVTVLFAGCSILPDGNSPSNTYQLGDPFELRQGESFEIDGITSISFIELKSDSRCPAGDNVRCIWEGEVEAAFGIQHTGEVFPVNFKGFPYSTDSFCEEESLLKETFNNYKIFLTRIDPYPTIPSQDITSNDIVARLQIFELGEKVTTCN